ncbi:TerC family protein [Paenibacillus cremeus]|uniref:TerC family protein n=2 Tax=Paenibacillus cremeus TaxID=2163881 RepID=A0A559KFZ6_9BACL|nr:TerC family protein [Paenibacillus cremeus]TVY11046.1 TerC family protein [Paenibacillus cremeus]
MKLILINLVLSGDNAIVIALACRNLPVQQQKRAVFWGSFGAIGLRVVLTFIAVSLLQIPFVQAAGGVLLFYIAIKLLKGNGKEEHVPSGTSMLDALKTIIFADLIMSLDNVLAMAGAANGKLSLIVLGLAISIPLIIWGSQLLMRLMNRFPIIITLGSGLLGYTSGEMLTGDQALGDWMEEVFPAGHYIVPAGLAFIVVLLGVIADRRKQLLLAAEGKQ